MGLLQALVWFDNVVKQELGASYGERFWYSLTYMTLAGAVERHDLPEHSVHVAIMAPASERDWLISLLKKYLDSVEPPYVVNETSHGSYDTVQLSSVNEAHLRIWYASSSLGGDSNDTKCLDISGDQDPGAIPASWVFPIEPDGCLLQRRFFSCVSEPKEVLGEFFGDGRDGYRFKAKKANPCRPYALCRFGIFLYVEF